jgi:hypothetical protein
MPERQAKWRAGRRGGKDLDRVHRRDATPIRPPAPRASSQVHPRRTGRGRSGRGDCDSAVRKVASGSRAADPGAGELARAGGPASIDSSMSRRVAAPPPASRRRPVRRCRTETRAVRASARTAWSFARASGFLSLRRGSATANGYVAGSSACHRRERRGRGCRERSSRAPVPERGTLRAPRHTVHGPCRTVLSGGRWPDPA